MLTILLAFWAEAGPPPRMPRPPSDLPKRIESPLRTEALADRPFPEDRHLGGGEDELLMRITRRVNLEDLEVRRRVMPDFPDAERKVRAHDCAMRLFIDEGGRPLRALPLECDARFVDTSEDALMEWRFEPYEVDGDAVPVRTDLIVEYRR